MSDGVLPLKYRRQECEDTCILACFGMVLEYYGIVETEEAIRHKLGFDGCGLKEAATEACSAYGLHGALEYGSRPDLLSVFDRQVPLIASMNVEGLRWGSEALAGNKHVVVVIGTERGDVVFLDPWEGIHPDRMPLSRFYTHWWGKRMVRFRVP